MVMSMELINEMKNAELKTDFPSKFLSLKNFKVAKSKLKFATKAIINTVVLINSIAPY